MVVSLDFFVTVVAAGGGIVVRVVVVLSVTIPLPLVVPRDVVSVVVDGATEGLVVCVVVELEDEAVCAIAAFVTTVRPRGTANKDLNIVLSPALIQVDNLWSGSGRHVRFGIYSYRLP